MVERATSDGVSEEATVWRQSCQGLNRIDKSANRKEKCLQQTRGTSPYLEPVNCLGQQRNSKNVVGWTITKEGHKRG